MKFKKVLVAVDGSKHAEKAAHRASGVACSQGAELVLFNCPGNIPRLIGGSAHEKLEKELIAEGKNILDGFGALCAGEDVKITSVVRVGDAAGEIVHYAEQNGVDLIVLGSRGLTDIEGVFLGSVSHSVLHRYDGTVLIVR